MGGDALGAESTNVAAPVQPDESERAQTNLSRRVQKRFTPLSSANLPCGEMPNVKLLVARVAAGLPSALGPANG